jgi:DNA-binding transcriptional LysR family regulator
MRITLQYFDGCPNWQITHDHLNDLVTEGLDAAIVYELIDSHEMAVSRDFRGSPTVLVEGADPFFDRHGQAGLACRIYETEAGPAGSPTLDQLRRAIATAETGD